MSKLGGVKKYSEPNCEKSLSIFTLSPGGLQAMSSHLLKASSSSASRLDLIDPLKDSLTHLYIYIYVLYMYIPSGWFCPLWPFLVMTPKFLSLGQTSSPGFIHIQLQVLFFDPHAVVCAASLPRTFCHVRFALIPKPLSGAILPTRLRDTGNSIGLP